MATKKKAKKAVQAPKRALASKDEIVVDEVDPPPPVAEPHPDYLFTVIVRALTQYYQTLPQSTFLVARATLRDLNVYAGNDLESDQAAKEIIVAFLGRYEEALLDKTGGGDTDTEILAGP